MTLDWLAKGSGHNFFKFIISGDRAMSPAQSEDSGLAADRGTTYATISLPRENAQVMGIQFLGKNLGFFFERMFI